MNDDTISYAELRVWASITLPSGSEGTVGTPASSLWDAATTGMTDATGGRRRVRTCDFVSVAQGHAAIVVVMWSPLQADERKQGP